MRPMSSTPATPLAGVSLTDLADQADASLNGRPLDGPAATTMALNLRDRISELEKNLDQERRALQECEARCRELEQRLAL